MTDYSEPSVEKNAQESQSDTRYLIADKRKHDELTLVFVTHCRIFVPKNNRAWPGFE
jgi:hypothetical protein